MTFGPRRQTGVVMDIAAELDMTAERAWELLSNTGHWPA
jgi:hypothetical protein